MAAQGFTGLAVQKFGIGAKLEHVTENQPLFALERLHELRGCEYRGRICVIRVVVDGRTVDTGKRLQATGDGTNCLQPGNDRLDIDFEGRGHRGRSTGIADVVLPGKRQLHAGPGCRQVQLENRCGKRGLDVGRADVRCVLETKAQHADIFDTG